MKYKIQAKNIAGGIDKRKFSVSTTYNKKSNRKQTNLSDDDDDDDEINKKA